MIEKGYKVTCTVCGYSISFMGKKRNAILQMRKYGWKPNQNRNDAVCAKCRDQGKTPFL